MMRCLHIKSRRTDHALSSELDAFYDHYEHFFIAACRNSDIIMIVKYCDKRCNVLLNGDVGWSLKAFTFFSAAQPCSHNIVCFFPPSVIQLIVYLTYPDIFFSVSTTGEKTTKETLCVLATQSRVRTVCLLLIKLQVKAYIFFLFFSFYHDHFIIASFLIRFRSSLSVSGEVPTKMTHIH